VFFYKSEIDKRNIIPYIADPQAGKPDFIGTIRENGTDDYGFTSENSERQIRERVSPMIH
jgi:hypothetical protein